MASHDLNWWHHHHVVIWTIWQFFKTVTWTEKWETLKKYEEETLRAKFFVVLYSSVIREITLSYCCCEVYWLDYTYIAGGCYGNPLNCPLYHILTVVFFAQWAFLYPVFGHSRFAQNHRYHLRVIILELSSQSYCHWKIWLPKYG